MRELLGNVMIGWVRRMAVVACCASILFGVVTAGVSTSVAATENESPLPDAGLDREVAVNATVILDASESRDPDGRVADYDWRIERPDGSHRELACVTCERTSFVPAEPGLYNATVTVTDDNGARGSDTVQISVDEADSPTVTLSGPDSVRTDETGNFTATVEAGNQTLSSAVWYLDGSRIGSRSLDGESDSSTITEEFGTSGTRTLSVAVFDRIGRSSRDHLNVTVDEPDELQNEGGNSGGNSAGESETQCMNVGIHSCDSDTVYRLGEYAVLVEDSDQDGVVSYNGQTINLEYHGDTAKITWGDDREEPV